MPKKIPMRQCVGCREMKPKRELVRIVHTPDGEIAVDISGKKSGRGAYICHDKGCLKQAIKTKALSRAFSAEIPDEIFDILCAQLEQEES